MARAETIAQLIFDRSGDALVVHDDNGRFVEANPAACRLLGYTRDELTRLALPDVEPDFDLFDIRQHWQQMKIGDAVTVEGRPRHKDGRSMHVEVRLSLIDDTPGARLYLASLRDMRARLPVMKALAESQARFRQLMEHAGDAFFLHDERGVILDVNLRACQALGYDRHQLVGANLADFDTVLSLDSTERPWDALGHDETRSWESVFRCADGNTYPVEVRLAAVHGERQPLFLSFVRDISARKLAEEQLADYVSQLATSNADLARYAAVASHDLREPLRKVMAFADLLVEECDQDLNEDAHQYLQVIISSVQRMSRLVDALLAYAQVGAQPANFAPVDLQKVLGDVVDDLALRIEETGATVTVEALPALEADVDQMRQLFQNLLSNALKYRHPERPPEVRVTARLEKSWAIIEVADNGIGFDPTYAERIFDPFARLHSKSEYEGAGIGLATCQRIVERHGGRIGATATPAQGAIFTVCLPRGRRKTAPLPGHTPI